MRSRDNENNKFLNNQDKILRQLAFATTTIHQLKTGRSEFGFRAAAINAGWV